MRLFLAVAFTLLLTWPAGAHAERRGADSMLVKAATPCDLGRAIAVKGMANVSGPQLFDDEPFKGTRIVRPPHFANPPPGAPAELLARWDASTATSLLDACPEARSALSETRMATAEDRARANGIQHGPNLMQVSAPMLSKAGDHMLIEVRFRCGGLCGSGTVMHYRKTPKGWLRMDPLALYIS